ncbi:Hint domain-containing protein [Gluconobacter kondonii]|uniref:Hint domain-containing protein n=1 Tax=Gluconobacter kondonii TaxID=941463 RepID=UPI0020A036D4|nr:Hint domain-containing protein [Gluconobacter kondonii]
MSSVTKKWSDVSQSGGTIGQSGVTTTLTGSPHSSIDGVNFVGDVILQDNGTVVFQDSTISANSSVTISTGTSLELNQSKLPSGTINMDGGSLKNTNASQNEGALTINFEATTATKSNTVELNAYGLNNLVTFNNVSPGDNIVFHNSYGQIKLVDNGKGIIEVEDTNGKQLTTLKTAQKSDGSYYTASDFPVSYDGVNSTLVCFLSGSLITTPSGTTTVEDFSVNDEIIAYVDGVATPRRVIWAGQAHCNVRSHLPDDEAGYPVRILKDAIADGVPFKDMLITAEHCLFFDGKFVPARMLVNGRSIFFDKSITSYDYYHIETENHSVIMADGMLTESYLDTGNRKAFTQKGNVISIGSNRNLTWDDAAAPLGVSREFAEPLSRLIEARANKADIAQKEQAPVLTDEANLRLITDTGASIRPAREHNGHVIFMIPTGVQSVRIASHASRPSDVIGPFVDDRRYFGVAVGEITMFEAGKSHAITAHLTDTELNGWNTLEWEDTRWTSGNGLLPLGDRHPNSIALLTIQIKKTGPYLLSDTIAKKDALQA